jgi:hypothetical protein
MSWMKMIMDGESGESGNKQLLINYVDYPCICWEGLSILTKYLVMIVCSLVKT